MKTPLDKIITEKSEFFDPDEFEYKVHGFFEEILDVDTNKQYGIRVVEKPNRPLGSPGTIEHTFTEDFKVLRNFQSHTIKASARRPKRCRLTLQAICGVLKDQTPYYEKFAAEMDKEIAAQTIHKRNLRKQKSLNVTLPVRFTPRFWEDSDNRISVVKLIRQRHELLKAHAGGKESAQRDLLCQRCAFVSVILETKEVQAAEGGELDLGSYVQSVNCLVGLLRALGLEKRIKSVSDLTAYLNEKEKGPKNEHH